MPDLKAHSFELTAELMIPEAEHLDALPGEELVSDLIFRPLVREAMAAPIKLHSQPGDWAVEIEEEDAARVLPSKFELSEAPVTEQAPETLF